MRKIIGYIGLFLAALLCTLLLGCGIGGSGEETTKNEETTESSAEAVTTEAPSIGKTTYTVPLYIEKDGTMQYEFSYATYLFEIAACVAIVQR